MPKHAEASTNVVRTPSLDGGTIVHFRPGWKNECDEHGDGRRPPTYQSPSGRSDLPSEPYTGESRVVAKFSGEKKG